MKIRTFAFFIACLLLLGGCTAGTNDPIEPNGSETSMNKTVSKETSEETHGTTQPTAGATIRAEDTVVITSETLRALQTSSGKNASVTIDIVCQLNAEKMTAAKIRAQITEIKNLGVTRVYLIMCSPSYPLMSGADITATNPGLTSSRLTESLRALGDDPNKVYIEACHALGLEAIAIIKPYEGGGGVSVPEGKTIDGTVSEYGSATLPATVGGSRAFMDTFISEHPEMRVARKAGSGQNLSATITGMEIYYYGGTIPSDLTVLNTAAANQPTLWVSRDNGSYTVAENVTYRYDVVKNYQITDANGLPLMKQNCIRLTITVNGLTAADKYIACSLRDDNYLMVNSFWSRPYSMAKLLGGSGEIPSTLGYYVRKPYSAAATPETFAYGAYATPVAGTALSGIRVSGGKAVGVYPSESTASGAENFTQWGFEFEYVYTSAVVNGFRSPLIALAVGKNEYVQGLLCEAYPEVRAYWLGQVEQALDYGADGIDIRPDGHSAMVSDWFYYGYNAPVAASYLATYGKALSDEPVNEQTARRVMEIRGSFYARFLESAATLTHERGKRFLCHFFATSFGGEEGSELPMGSGSNEAAQWKMPKILLNDYKKIVDFCDEIVYKDYYTQYFVSSDWSLGERLTNYIRSQNKPIWIHCYVQQSNQLNNHFFENFLASGREGVILYEIVPTFNYEEAKTYLNTYIQSKPAWEISVLGRISGIPKGTTARGLIAMLNLLGENAVVDAGGNSVPLDTVLTADMRLCLNKTAYYKFQIN